jgi:type VI secretion system protein ImpA
LLSSATAGDDAAQQQRGIGKAAMVDTEILLQPTSESSPCGEALDYDIDFLELEIAARGRSEQQMGDAVSAGEEPDWRAVETMAEALCGRSKDLRVAVLLARARLRNDGFAGFEEGLRLLAGYAESYWDTVHPMPEPDEDETIRINALAALADPAYLLGDVRRAPLVHSASLGAVSLRDVQIANRRLTPGADTPAVTLGDIEARFLAAPPHQLAAAASSLKNCADAVDVMAKIMTERGPGDLGNPLDALAETLREARAEVDSHIAAPTPQAVGDAAQTGEDGEVAAAVAVAAAPMRAAVASGEIRGRADIVMMLDRICRWYATNEPASPVPDLLERAKRLVSQNFLALLLELAPAGADQFRALAGIRDAEN